MNKGIANIPQDEHWKVLIHMLRHIAEQKNITKQEIADRTGLKRSSVSRILQAHYQPKLPTVLKIASAIGIHLFVEDKDGTSDLALALNRALEDLRIRGDQKN